MNRRALRSAAGSALLVAASVAVFLLAAEGAVRLFRPQPMASVSRSARLGWLHKPNTELVYERQEFRIPVHFSSAGLRDREYAMVKPPGTFRIVWLGDSFVEALQVPLDSCVTERVEAALARTPGPRREVLNFGVSGYGSCQQLFMLEDFALAFEPDLVLAQTYSNDFDDDRRFGACLLDSSGGLRVVPPGGRSARRRIADLLKSHLLRHSHLWVFVSTRRARWGREPQPAATARAEPAPAAERAHDEAGGVSVPSCPGRHRSLEWMLTLRELPPDAAAAVSLQGVIWDRMAAHCRDRGAVFAVVLGVSRTQTEPSVYAKTLADTGCRAEAHDLRLLPERLAAVASASGIPVFDLEPAFQRATAAGDTLHFRIDGHWSAAGHRVAAAAVCDALSAHGMLEAVQP